MTKINLLPKRHFKADSRFLIKGGILFLIFIGILFTARFLNQNILSEINRLKAKQSSLEIRLVQYKNQAKEYEKYEFLAKKLEYKKSIMDSIFENRQNLIRILDAIGGHLPQEAWLEKLSQKKEKITVSGYAKDNETISDFLIRLENSKIFNRVILISAEHYEKNNNRLKKFTILCESKLI